MASTAMIQHEIDVPLHKLSEQIGRARAERVWRRSARSVEDLEELVRRLGMSCGMKPARALFLAGDAFGARALAKEAEYRQRAGLAAEYMDGDQLRETYNISRTAAIRSEASASVNPAQLTAGILREARKQGCEIIGDMEITDLHARPDEVVLATSTGHILVAGQVVFCTGYEFLKPLAHTQHEIISTWALASRPGIDLPAWLSDHLVWEGSDPYIYLRTSADGRLIVGGEDETSPDAHQDPDKLARKGRIICEKTGDLLGCAVGKPEYVWAAAFGNTRTGLPMIGAVPGLDNVHAVMGYGGNGITFSMIASQIVTAAIDGQRDPDADLFPFVGS